MPMQQNQMQTTQMSVANINGRYVNDQNEITANEVPMTGKYALFPKNDMSEIYAKAWNANGQIQTICYTAKPLVDESQKTPVIDSESLRELNERLDRIERMLTPKKTTRKDVNADE